MDKFNILQAARYLEFDWQQIGQLVEIETAPIAQACLSQEQITGLAEAAPQAGLGLNSILDYLRYAYSSFQQADLYYGHGTDNAWDEAYALVLDSLHLPHDIDQNLLNANLTLAEKSRFDCFFKLRIKQRIPSAYLTNTAWFCGLPFYVDDRVIIPRSPFAELITNEFSPWVDQTEVKQVLDLCTGSGCIAIACAHAFPEAIVDAVDLSADALDIAQRNIQEHELEGQVNLFKSDLFKQLPEKKYDLIISNPPYVDAEDIASLPAEFLWEPNMALAGGEAGIDLVEQILAQAKDYLTDDGYLIVEVGNSQNALAEKYPNLPFVWLEFSHGGQGVFLLTAKSLSDFAIRHS